MNTRRNVGKREAETAAGRNQDTPQALVDSDQLSVNPTWLTNVEVRNALLQIAQTITTQAQAITSQSAREDASRENSHARTMAGRVRYFMRMNPTIYYGSTTHKNPLEFVDEVHKILCAMGDGE